MNGRVGYRNDNDVVVVVVVFTQGDFESDLVSQGNEREHVDLGYLGCIYLFVLERERP